jgi:exonuclease V gamma subunit
MALNIFHSNDYAWLLQRLVAGECEALAHRQDPFEISNIWLASNADEWEIRRGFCDVNGIAANLVFSPLADGLWATSSQLFSGLGAHSPFSEDSLKPLIFEVLEAWSAEVDFKETSRAWLPLEQSQRLVVAARLAGYFARYVTYRQVMLNQWVALPTHVLGEVVGSVIDSDTEWQKRLWLALAEKISLIGKPHPFSFLKTLTSSTTKPQEIRRFHVFNPLAFAPLYEDALWHLSRVHHVSVYFFNPSPLNWHDRNDTLPRLLAGLGQERRYAFERLNRWIEAGATETTFYVDHLDGPLQYSTGATRALPEIKSQFYHLQVPAAKPHLSKPLSAGDIVLFSCSTIAEQFSSVRVSIENHLERDAFLRLSDILVLLPRDASYQRACKLLPWVWNEGLTQKLPYRLSGIEVEAEDAAAQAWLALLDIVQSDFELDVVFDWLNLSAVSARLALSTEELTRWKDWARTAGIRRGLVLSETGSHSWQAGIDWLLLSYAGQVIPNDPSELAISGLELELLGKVMAEIAALAQLAGQARSKYASEAWIQLLNEALETLVLFDGCDVIQEASLRELIASLKNIKCVDKDVGLSFETIKVWFLTDKNLLNSESERTTLQRSPTLTVAPLGALRGQAFKVIYVLGAEKIPISIAGGNLDLMVKYPEVGDPSLREGDLCSVLDVLIAAEQSVEISYLGKDPVNQTVLAEPMLVSLLTASLAELGLAPQVTVVTKVPTGFANNTLDNSLNTNQLPFWLQGKRSLQVSEQDVETVDEQVTCLVDLTDPLRYYLKRHVGIIVFDEDSTLDAAEPFELDYLDLWRRRKDHLANPLSLLRRNFPQGSYGKLSALAADLEIDEAQRLAAMVSESNSLKQSALCIEAKRLGWSVFMKALIELCSTNQNETIVIARHEYMRISMPSSESERKALLIALIALRAAFQEKPFVFGQTAAYAYLKSVMKVGGLDNAITVPSPKLWKGRDGQQTHDLLWAHLPVHSMPSDMAEWLQRLVLTLKNFGMNLHVGNATELADWVVSPDNSTLQPV